MERFATFLIALIAPKYFALANATCYSHPVAKNTHFEYVDFHNKD